MSAEKQGGGDHGHHGMSVWAKIGAVLLVLILVPFGINSCSSEVSNAAAKLYMNNLSINFSLSLIGRVIVGAAFLAIIAIIVRHYTKE